MPSAGRIVGDVTIVCVLTIAFHFLPAVIRQYATQHPENHVRILDLKLTRFHRLDLPRFDGRFSA